MVAIIIVIESMNMHDVPLSPTKRRASATPCPAVAHAPEYDYLLEWQPALPTHRGRHGTGKPPFVATALKNSKTILPAYPRPLGTRLRN